jgi:hypothetical protein
MMGFRLRENFDVPYIARSMTEFWRRWHMSLTSWIRDYLYVPLGGNRRALGAPTSISGSAFWPPGFGMARAGISCSGAPITACF